MSSPQKRGQRSNKERKGQKSSKSSDVRASGRLRGRRIRGNWRGKDHHNSEKEEKKKKKKEKSSIKYLRDPTPSTVCRTLKRGCKRKRRSRQSNDPKDLGRGEIVTN